jgi:hypothetical protein
VAALKPRVNGAAIGHDLRRKRNQHLSAVPHCETPPAREMSAFAYTVKSLPTIDVEIDSSHCPLIWILARSVSSFNLRISIRLSGSTNAKQENAGRARHKKPGHLLYFSSLLAVSAGVPGRPHHRTSEADAFTARY